MHSVIDCVEGLLKGREFDSQGPLTESLIYRQSYEPFASQMMSLKDMEEFEVSVI